jgi:hypothetical protein
LAEVEQLVERIAKANDRNLVRAYAALSTPAFEAVWDNPEDEAYDAL